MAYNNYGAWVFLNEHHRKDKENVEIYNQKPLNDAVWCRVWQQVKDNYTEEDESELKSSEWEYLHHAVLGDGDVRLGIYKETLSLFHKNGDKVVVQTLICDEWEQFQGLIFEDFQEDTQSSVYVKKYNKRYLGLDSFRSGWLRPRWLYAPRMEVLFSLMTANTLEIWYSLSGVGIGSTHYGGKIPKYVKKLRIKMLRNH